MKLRSVVSLLFLWLSFGWKVRKARKAFEKELVKAGMAKGNAKKLSAWYSKLKKDVTQTVKSHFLLGVKPSKSPHVSANNNRRKKPFRSLGSPQILWLLQLEKLWRLRRP